MSLTFLKYLRQRVKFVLLPVLFTGIFSGIISLYNAEVEAVFYAAVLCLLTGLIFFGIGFYRHQKKYHQLEDINKNILLLMDDLPEPRGIIESEYQEMLRHLLREYREMNATWQEERNDSIDFYTAWVHQIKAPIAIMRLVLQGEERQSNQELLYELFRIEQYTEMVLSYYRLDSNSNDFVIQEYALDPIIRQAVRKYAAQFVRQRMKLQYDGTDLVVLSDGKWLGFIIEQLLSNAIKYTGKGTVMITVTNQVLTISDTGIGIAAEDLPRIFEKGFTGYNGRGDKKSTGLGLYLCKRAADKLSHTLSVSSQVGKGTQVQLDLSRKELEIK